jgi:hypothetical protein
MEAVMRKPAAAAASLAWFIAIGGTFGCLLPYLLDYWHFHQRLPQESTLDVLRSGRWRAVRCAAMIGA